MTAQIPLVGGNYYHIYNRGNNGETIFRTEEEQKTWQLAASCQVSPGWQPCPPSRAFKNLFIAYSMAFNTRYERTGSLFQKPFKRRLVDSDHYFAALVRYIHRNPEKHGLIPDFREWPWSSYEAILAERPTRILRDDVLAWFGGRAPFIALHQTDPDERSIAHFIIE